MELKKVSGAAAAALIATSLNMAPVAAIAETPQADYKDAPDNDKAAESSVVGTTTQDSAITTETAKETAPSTSASSAQAARPAAAESIYTISDNYPKFATQIKTAVDQGAETIRLVTDSITDGSEVAIPASIKTFIGWQNRGFFGEEGTRLRDLGYYYDLKVSFPADSNITIDHINFNKAAKKDAVGATAIVDKGATVHFKDCTFANTPTVNGTATFENCTFKTGEINNNGTANYTGSTVEPKNIGTPDQGAYSPLAISMTGTDFNGVVTGNSVDQALPFTLAGTGKDQATVTAKIDNDESGLSASVENGQVKLTGKAAKAGSYTVTLTAQCTKPTGGVDTTTQTLHVDVQERITVELRGSLQAFTTTQSSAAIPRPEATQPLLRSSASGGGGHTGSQTATNKLSLYVTEGSSEAVSILDFQRAHPNTRVSLNINPDGSGMHAQLIYDTIYVNGTPAAAGTYQITATVTDGARSAISNSVDLRIYENNKNLSERLADLPAGTESWDMEPYEIAHTGNAVIPTTLKHIWGSHESGVYGQIGSGKKDYASETLTIPAGADVTISNMKIHSSVTVIVEKGAKLTLDDSVAFGPIEVNGGTLSTGARSTTTDTITLNEGSTLENANLNSHAHYLTDGSYTAPESTTPVVINGNVTIKGDVTITGDEGTAGTAGQAGMVIKSGIVTIPEGSTLTVSGGDTVEVYPSAGGSGIVMSEGSQIKGAGTLITTGGKSYQNKAGHGIAGVGIVDVGTLKATGGASAPEDYPTVTGRHGQAGDGVMPTVKVRATNLSSQGGTGEHPGSDKVTPYDPSEPDPQPQTGWQQVDGTWYYYNTDGSMVTGWLQLDNAWYYLQSWGGMALGWQDVDGTWYHFDASGAMQTGWLQLDGSWYYLKDWGGMALGWEEIDGTWYYLGSSGAMVTGTQTIDGTVYRFASSGALVS